MTSTTKPIIQKIQLSKEQLQEVEMINKGMSVPKTTVVKNSMRKYAYEYTTKARPLSEKQQHEKLRKIYGGLCCICGSWPDYKVFYDMEGAKRVERYCQKHYHDAFIKGGNK